MAAIAITSNGPGEFSGWVRPLAAALLERAPQTQITAFFVPDDYATGGEPAAMQRLFPAAVVIAPKDYLRFAVGARLDRVPARADAVVYLGGDLLHAAAVHRRLGGRFFSYKFARKRAAPTLVLAVDEANRAHLRAQRIPGERIAVVGNLAIDGALAEARGAFGSGPPGDEDAARDGIIILPGTRKHEVANLIPFFLAAAQRLRRLLGEVRIAFGLSPFTSDDEVAAALAAGGDPRVYGSRGRLVREGDRRSIVAEGATDAFPVVRHSMRTAAHARMALTIPGTKCIELAALGVPMVACTPLNAPELAVINGPLTYLDRLPFIGVAIKRAVVLRVAARFPFMTQPNIDSGEALIAELRGTLTPGRVAGVTAERFADGAWLANSALRLRDLYAGHAGAAARAAAAILGDA